MQVQLAASTLHSPQSEQLLPAAHAEEAHSLAGEAEHAVIMKLISTNRLEYTGRTVAQ
jgi:hypothetical protein